mmetsp:Transcript_72436/g.223845  ORF Transcript_72436/g.223845 Transcript_72436/m.223845 type:complete len:276 (+) Transcript_72436:104-931(+)
MAPSHCKQAVPACRAAVAASDSSLSAGRSAPAGPRGVAARPLSPQGTAPPPLASAPPGLAPPPCLAPPPGFALPPCVAPPPGLPPPPGLSPPPSWVAPPPGLSLPGEQPREATGSKPEAEADSGSEAGTGSTRADGTASSDGFASEADNGPPPRVPLPQAGTELRADAPAFAPMPRVGLSFEARGRSSLPPSVRGLGAWQARPGYATRGGVSRGAAWAAQANPSAMPSAGTPSAAKAGCGLVAAPASSWAASARAAMSSCRHEHPAQGPPVVLAA